MKSLRYYVKLLGSIPKSFFFCLKQLPFNQAIRLPILLYKSDILSVRGGVILVGHVSFGMVRLGFRRTAVYPNNGIVWKNDGVVVFHGKCDIGNSSYIVCGEKGEISFGENFFATGGLRIVSECGIEIGSDTLVGWGNTIIDTDFHPLYLIESRTYSKGYGRIYIGKNNWFASFCMVLHSVETADNCVFSTRSIINRKLKCEKNCLYGGQPIHLLKRQVMLDINKRTLDYSKKL